MGRAPARRVHPEAGMSIPEVLVAALLLAVGVGGVVATLGTSGEAAATGRHQSTAAGIATGEVEVIRSVPYDEVGIAASSPGYVPRFEGRDTVTGAVNRVEATGTTTVDVITYELERHITWRDITVGGSPIARGYKQVTIIVSWSDGTGPHQVRLDSGRYEGAG